MILYVLMLLYAFGVRADFVLDILHTNDVHSRIEELNKYGGSCSQLESKQLECFGGVARRYTVVESIRNNSANVILLDGGDQYQGTMWFSYYKGTAAVTFMNYTRYDAMALGNHEFDNGPKSIVSFIKQANFSIVSSNINVSAEPVWPKPPMLVKSTILKRNGNRIGVIGYITPETTWLSSPGPNIKFGDVVSSVRLEAKKLKASGVKILIALGHAGFKTDKKIASEIPELDVVVGGHTNTFLYSGTAPSSETPEGPYPVVTEHSDGTKVLVVQDFTYGKYLGHLKVTFDDDGKVKKWSGNPILLNSSYAQDPKVLAMVKEMDDPIIKARKDPVGKTYVHLEGGKPDCRTRDCNLGNLVADAVVKMNQRTPDALSWATVALAIWNGGGLRASINKKRQEPITVEDINTVLPFGNTADIANITGKILKEAFEHSVSGIDELKGRFLQSSGFRVRYNKDAAVGSRILEIKVLCIECLKPKYELLDESKSYKVIVPVYLLRGGDNFAMLKDIPRHPGSVVSDIVRRYIAQESPITASYDDRFIPITVKKCPKTTSSSSKFGPSIILCFILAFYILIV